MNNQTVNSHLTSAPRDNEYDSLLALLSTQPRVTAPADFDFKLRARIARAEAEPRGSLKQAGQAGVAGWLAGFWAKSFRPGQAIGALAAIALFVAASTIFINRGTQPTSQADTRLAVVSPALPANTQTANPSALRPEALRIERAVPKAGSVRAGLVSFKSKPAPEGMRPAVNRESIAWAEDASSFYRRDKGQMGRISNRPVSIGAEDAALAKPQTVALSF